MIDINSNCSRVDAVKTMASQLKMQAAQVPHATPANTNYKSAQGKLQALDTAIKKGDAQQAENAFSSAKSAINQLQSQSTGQGGRNLLNTYA